MDKMMHALYMAQQDSAQSVNEVEADCDDVMNEMDRLRKELEKDMTPEQKAQLTEYGLLCRKVEELMKEKQYIRGFTDGLRMMANAVHPYDVYAWGGGRF